jgi:hypothetical protein
MVTGAAASNTPGRHPTPTRAPASPGGNSPPRHWSGSWNGKLRGTVTRDGDGWVAYVRLEDPPVLSPITTVGRFGTVEVAQVATNEVWAFHSGSSDTPSSSTFVFRLGFRAKTSNYLVTLTNLLFESFRLTHHGFQVSGQTIVSPRQGINRLLILHRSLPSPHHHHPALPLRLTSTPGT